MRILPPLFLLSLVTACSHPLHISGEGDILSSNSNHSCSLEEQPCENWIIGDYFVTYTAEPREGWHFDGWEGCGDQFPECTINVPSAAVRQNWGETMPPLKAAFLRDAPRSKVLILFDNSGSMNILMESGDTTSVYEPSATYPDAGYEEDKVYWSLDSTPPMSYSPQSFPTSNNRCETSLAQLAAYGTFKTKAKRWVTGKGWRDLSSSYNDPVHVDCQADVLSGEEGNGPHQTAGLPNEPGAPGASDDQAYTTSGASNVEFGNKTYTWYTAHYLNWLFDPANDAKTRLGIAQEAVSDLVNTNTSIDFGLSVFNHNSDGKLLGLFNCFGTVCPILNTEGDNGGRIIAHLKDNISAYDRWALAGPGGIINSLTASGTRPLSESMYEMLRYLSGQSPLYGLKQDAYPFDFWAGHDSALDFPNYDPQAFSPSLDSYRSPTQDCASTYVILMTTGLPSADTDANSIIESGFGTTCPEHPTEEGLIEKNCLAEITRYMANNDLDHDPENGDQFGITYTIGFMEDQQLLYEAAINGKGEYFFANSAEALTNAFNNIIADISSRPNNTCDEAF